MTNDDDDIQCTIFTEGHSMEKEFVCPFAYVLLSPGVHIKPPRISQISLLTCTHGGTNGLPICSAGRAPPRPSLVVGKNCSDQQSGSPGVFFLFLKCIFLFIFNIVFSTCLFNLTSTAYLSPHANPVGCAL